MNAPTSQVRVRYAPADEPSPQGEGLRLSLPTDAVRGACRLDARLQRPGVTRDALLTMSEILTSDLRRKATSRADYLAYLLSKGKRVTAEVWNAQKAFLEEQYGAAAQTEGPLDPIVHVDATGLSLEVFSADESAYARLHLHADEAVKIDDQQPGTSHLDLASAQLHRAVGRVRAYRPTALALSPSVDGIDRAFEVPHRWLRAFGQVQAASTLPATSFELNPIDLYNLLLTLRLKRARKSPRALRYELVPGERPRLVLEPWEQVIESTSPVYEGGLPVVVRTWGRRRLAALSRMLPHARRVTVHLVGPGLPAYYVLDLGDSTLTMALSGWTDSGWAGIATFDVLTAVDVDEALSRRVAETLTTGALSLDALAATLDRPRAAVRNAVLDQMQRGAVLHCLATSTLVHRPLMVEPPAPELLRFRDDREREAHRLLDEGNAVTVTKVHHLPREGTRIEGEVNDARAHRAYETSFTLDREGRTVDAACTSPQFRRSGLREGPTVPMLALRLQYGREQARLERERDTPKGRQRIVAETRVMTRRKGADVVTYRVSLDDREVVVRWGPRPDAMRMQRMFFGTPDGAKAEYFGRLEGLGARGFVDASAAEAM